MSDILTYNILGFSASWHDWMRLNDRKRRGGEEKGERGGGGRDLGEQCYKSSSMQKRKCRKRKSGNLWVKTCFLGKGLSPSKLSTKALCGNTRKRGNEKTEGH